MKPIIEPHVHMIARTTDDYMAMYAHGIRVCVEPSFWLGENRRYAGSFFDYFRLSLEFEHTRAARYGVDHWSAIGMNPKEAEDRALADAVIDGMGEYLDHPRCVAMGEIGYFFGEPQQKDEYRVDNETKNAVLAGFLDVYDEADDAQAWFAKVKSVAASLGFAAEMRDYKADPSAYKGSVSDVAEVLRIAVTGRANSPDLWTIMQILGDERARARLSEART